MKNLRILPLLAIVLFLAACQTARYNSQVAEDVIYANFDTYAFLPDNDTVEFSIYDSEIVYDKTVAKVKEEMDQRGYRLDPENPDLLIMIHYMFERDTERVYDPLYPSYSYYYPGFVVSPWFSYYYIGFNSIPEIYGPGWKQVKYTEGTIAVDIIREEDQKLIWRGWSEDRINPRTFTSDIQRYIEKIFNQYPVDD